MPKNQFYIKAIKHHQSGDVHRTGFILSSECAALTSGANMIIKRSQSEDVIYLCCLGLFLLLCCNVLREVVGQKIKPTTAEILCFFCLNRRLNRLTDFTDFLLLCPEKDDTSVLSTASDTKLGYMVRVTNGR